MDPLDNDVEDHRAAGRGVALGDVSQHGRRRRDADDGQRGATERTAPDEPGRRRCRGQHRGESKGNGHAERGADHAAHSHPGLGHLHPDHHEASGHGGGPPPDHQGERGRWGSAEDDHARESRPEQHEQPAVQDPTARDPHRRDRRRSRRLGRSGAAGRRSAQAKGKGAPGEVSVDRGDRRPGHRADALLEGHEPHA